MVYKKTENAALLSPSILTTLPPFMSTKLPLVVALCAHI